jgi:lipopolysaccharide transport system permease protein
MSAETLKFTSSITPKDHLFELRLKDIWRFRDLLWQFVYRDFVTVYKQTILGPLWFFIQPFLTTIVFTVIFGKIAQIPTDGLPQMLFYLAGVTAWHYFSECFRKTANTFTQNAYIFGKVFFPRVIVPLSITVSNLITFGIQMLLFLSFMIYFMIAGAAVHPNVYILLFPILILIMGIMGLGFGMIVSAMTTKYRDLQNLVGFGIQLMMYAAPVIYPLSSIPGKYQLIILANPMTAVIETFRFSFLGAGSFSWIRLIYSGSFTIVIFFLGLLVFNKTEKNFMDSV